MAPALGPEIAASLSNASALAQSVDIDDTQRQKMQEEAKANAGKNMIQLLSEQGPSGLIKASIVTGNSAIGIKHEVYREMELWKKSMPTLRTYRTLREANEAPYEDEELPSQNSGK